MILTQDTSKGTHSTARLRNGTLLAKRILTETICHFHAFNNRNLSIITDWNIAIQGGTSRRIHAATKLGETLETIIRQKVIF